MAGETLRMLDMEEQLAGPDAPEVMKRYDEMLVALDRRRTKAMDEGLVPEDFQRCQLLGEAILLARKILRLTVQK